MRGSRLAGALLALTLALGTTACAATGAPSAGQHASTNDHEIEYLVRARWSGIADMIAEGDTTDRTLQPDAESLRRATAAAFTPERLAAAIPAALLADTQLAAGQRLFDTRRGDATPGRDAPQNHALALALPGLRLMLEKVRTRAILEHALRTAPAARAELARRSPARRRARAVAIVRTGAAVVAAGRDRSFEDARASFTAAEAQRLAALSLADRARLTRAFATDPGRSKVTAIVTAFRRASDAAATDAVAAFLADLPQTTSQPAHATAAR